MVPILKYGEDDMSRVFSRTQLDNSEYISAVDAIISDVRARGDEALFEYALKFDRQVIDGGSILVSKEEIDAAYKSVDAKLVESIRKAKASILAYHSRQKDKFVNEFFPSGNGGNSKLGWIYRTLSRL